MVDFN
jgi:hypothetical protein